jgi:uncharacterized membrane protein
MTPLRMASVTCVTVALALYTVGTIQEQRARRATAGARGFLAAGVCMDVIATILMILATERRGISLHGVLGYSALAAMALDTWLLWRHQRRHGSEVVPRGLHLYSRAAYLYWVAAFITGGALVMMGQRG